MDCHSCVQVARCADETIPMLSRRFGWVTMCANVEKRFDNPGGEADHFGLMLQSDAWDPDATKARSLQMQYHLMF